MSQHYFAAYTTAPEYQSYLPTAGQPPYNYGQVGNDAYNPYPRPESYTPTGPVPIQLQQLAVSSRQMHKVPLYSPMPSPLEQHTVNHFSASSESGASLRSSTSSAVASPCLPPHIFQEQWTARAEYPQDGYFPNVLDQSTGSLTLDADKFYSMAAAMPPTQAISPMGYLPYSEYALAPSPHIIEHPTSPAGSMRTSRIAMKQGKHSHSPAQSPYLRAHQYHPYAQPNGGRRGSTASALSHPSQSSPRSGSFEAEEEPREKGQCPFPQCRRIVKDLKAHIWTHQDERPEKCPIPTCEYHTKGFARKYDKNRHTLTHYKGTMVCGFCTGAGSAAEKSFNRADVFKRHLTTVHGVEQAPPNSRRKSPTAKKSPSEAEASSSSGKCSTCHVTFANAQEFYEHLDDCVLRVVQQVEPSEAINEKHLMDVAQDSDVKDRLERHGLSDNANYTAPAHDERDDDEDAEGDDDDITPDAMHPHTTINSTATTAATSQPLGDDTSSDDACDRTRRPGLTWSKGGVAFEGTASTAASTDTAAPKTAAGGRRGRRKDMPASWARPAGTMKMKKRVLCVYDGQRRLWKDDMMLDQEFEVRVRLEGPDEDGNTQPTLGGRYVTDLDIQTLRRADGVFSATEEERGPWIPDNVWQAPLEDAPQWAH